jgi:8-oxo-dGTP pyrophosphatase MutT (NUDIX family)
MINPPLRHNLFHIPANVAFGAAAVAIIVLDDGRYLMQLRDDKPGIFYPDHWGLFGGGIDAGETAEAALRRELREELNYEPAALDYFTCIEFDFACLGGRRCPRIVYEIPMPLAAVDRLSLGEGQSMKALEAEDILLDRRVVPYDSFAIWMHYARRQRALNKSAS